MGLAESAAGKEDPSTQPSPLEAAREGMWGPRWGAGTRGLERRGQGSRLCNSEGTREG